MIRKTLIALAAAATLALGMSSLSKPAAADIVINIGGGHHHGLRHGFYHGGRPYCGLRTVRIWRHHHWTWRTVRVCRSYRHW
jgi:hypothetical protein